MDREQARELLLAPDTSTLKGKRNRAILAVLLGCGLRRSELVALEVRQVEQRENRWVIVDFRARADGSGRSRCRLGEERDRRVEGGRPDHPRADLPLDREGRPVAVWDACRGGGLVAGEGVC